MLVDELENTERLTLQMCPMYYDYLLFWPIQMTYFVITINFFKNNMHVEL